ncbi:MAG TPA: oxidoreductase [Actinobacteria bacterium]|nr:oxidoreductase [Actinomycetota bacterium]
MPCHPQGDEDLASAHLRILAGSVSHHGQSATSTLVIVTAPPRLRVGVIGTGRAGSVIAAALQRAGHPVIAASAVSDLSRLRAQALLPNTPIVDLAEVAVSADLVLVAVPDDALIGLVQGLAMAGVVTPGQFWMHLSGRYGIQALDAVTKEGALPLAVHPVMSFTGTSIDLSRLTDCPFGVTAPEALRTAAEALVIEMGGEPVWVPEASRPLYHAALAFGSNFLITLVAQSTELLQRAGIDQPQRVLGPLLGASLDNALRLGDQALTGPVARGDARSVAAHIEVIGNESSAAEAAYRALARVTADRAVEAGLLSASLAGPLLEVLNSHGDPS